MKQARTPQSTAKIPVAGVGFDPLSEATAVDRLVSSFKQGTGGRAVFVNVDVLVKLDRRPELLDLVSSAELVLADGMPLIWASRLQGTPLPERVAGSSLLPLLVARSAVEGIPVMIVGGKPGSAETAAETLKAAHPGLRVGWHTPPFGFEDDPGATVALEHALDGFGRCMCFLGLGFPKQELLMADLSTNRRDWWFIACGGGIDFLARNDRAPVWMQRGGLEWAYRLIREPKRLARRYLIEDIPYASRMLTAAAWRGRGT